MIQYKHMNKFLQESEQTKVTPQIKKLAEEFKEQDSLKSILNTLFWIDENIKMNRERTDVFRERTADQILSDKYSTGCTDYAILYIAISRAMGIPTKYVELLSIRWLESDEEKIQGHVIAEVLVDDKRLFVDPTHGSISTKPTSGMVIYDKGLDSWNIGIKNRENLGAKFMKFREKWKKKQSGA